VKQVDGTTGIAELVGYQMNSSHIRRLIRKAIKRIDDSFVLKTKDNVSYAVKPLLIARHKTTQSVATTIRKRVRDLLTKSFQNMKSDEIFMHVITNKLQMDVKNDVRKVYPLAISEIRMLKRLN
jgi:ribosomal protein S3AE